MISDGHQGGELLHAISITVIVLLRTISQHNFRLFPHVLHRVRLDSKQVNLLQHTWDRCSTRTPPTDVLNLSSRPYRTPQPMKAEEASTRRTPVCGETRKSGAIRHLINPLWTAKDNTRFGSSTFFLTHFHYQVYFLSINLVKAASLEELECQRF